jgi:hypothetical protein
MYGPDTWAFRKAYINRLLAADMRFLRITEGEARTKGIINVKLEKKLKIMH